MVKNGGVMLVSPAWNCAPWAADGYPVRPYSDFGWSGKLYKFSIPFRAIFSGLGLWPVSVVRETQWKLSGEATRLRYRRLEANYEKYWMPDSDAINQLARHEVGLWFRSRGDECLNCDDPQEAGSLVHPLVIRVRK